MQLLIDSGNSRTKWQMRNGQHVAASGRVDNRGVDGLESDWAELPPPASVYCATVVGPDVNQRLAEIVRRLWKQPIRFLTSHAGGWGILSGYTHPQQLGVDRFAALVAAHDEFPAGVIVVDVGTAVTIDVLYGKDHQGGVILPGLHGMTFVTCETTVGVLEHDSVMQPADRGGALGRDTANGLSLGALYAVAGACTMIRTHHGGERPLLLCGGDAGEIATLLNGPVLLRPDLVFDGMALMASRDKENDSCGSYS